MAKSFHGLWYSFASVFLVFLHMRGGQISSVMGRYHQRYALQSGHITSWFISSPVTGQFVLYSLWEPSFNYASWVRSRMECVVPLTEPVGSFMETVQPCVYISTCTATHLWQPIFITQLAGLKPVIWPGLSLNNLVTNIYIFTYVGMLPVTLRHATLEHKTIYVWHFRATRLQCCRMTKSQIIKQGICSSSRRLSNMQ